MQERIANFLGDNAFYVNKFNREELLTEFLQDMRAGLAGKDSTVLMIPSFISPDTPVEINQPVVVLDAGGTNLRAAVVQFAANGGVELLEYKKTEMPGSLEYISAQDFFAVFADFIEPYLTYSQKIGFCFSYAAEITPECDARLIRWSKQIRAPEVEGMLVGAALKQVLAKRGHNCQITILNDTVATLLAGKSRGVAKNYSSYAGFILGTGTNTAYIEQNINITKRHDLNLAGSMVINVESGTFGKLQRSRFDTLLDNTTLDPGAYRLEKMMAGAYLGDLGYIILQEAAVAGLLSTATAQHLNAMGGVSNKELDDFCAGVASPDNPLCNALFTPQDITSIKALCSPIYQRATILAAVNLASIIIKSSEKQTPGSLVCVNVDGSTFYRTRTVNFQQAVEQELDNLLGSRQIAYELVKLEDSPITGAAVAGLA